MPRPPANQNELVQQYMREEGMGTPVTEQLRVPGVETLHLMPREDIADVFVNVLKSRSGITEVKWVVGKYFEITYQPKTH